MNTRYSASPELIASSRIVDQDGENTNVKDLVTSIEVRKVKEGPAIVQIDMRGFKKNQNLVIEVELAELVAALSHATVNAEEP
jgi:hypothetical protein